MELQIGCVAGVLEDGEDRAKPAAAGFCDIDVQPSRTSRAEDARAFLATAGLDRPGPAEPVDGRFMSAFVRATKPAAAGRRRGPAA